MKKLAIALPFLALVLGVYLSVRWLYLRWGVAVVAGKSPRTAIATVVKKEHVRLSDRQQTVSFPNGPSITWKDERFYVYYRLDEFTDVDPAASKAILNRERVRHAKEGPRRMEVGEQEYDRISDGQRIAVKYAYYPNVLWGVSDEIRVPW